MASYQHDSFCPGSPRRSDRPLANLADESPSKRTARAITTHLHQKFALLDIYDLSDAQRGHLLDSDTLSKDIREFEACIANILGVNNEMHSSILTSNRAPFRYRCRISLAAKDTTPSVQFMNPLVWRECIYFNEFGAERFLYAAVLISREVCSELCDKTFIKSDIQDRLKVKALGAYWNPDVKKWSFDRKRQDPDKFARWTPHTHPELPKTLVRFIESGIKFAGCTYKFLCGKASENKEDEKGISESGTFFHAFFFAERGPRELNWPYVSVQQARFYLGDFGDAKVMKLNHRLNLGFTSIYSGCKVPAGNVLVVPDICNPGGKIMTDGCGFISADLLLGTPLDISSGVPAPEGVISTNRCTPVIIQIRMSSPEGLFKGNLIVTDDAALCPRGKVVMRDSMRKADGARRFDMEDMARAGASEDVQTYILGIVNTFLSSSHDDSGRLNKQLVLLLHSLGVPKELILSLVIEEVRNGLVDLRDPFKARKTAYKIVREGRARPRTVTTVTTVDGAQLVPQQSSSLIKQSRRSTKAANTSAAAGLFHSLQSGKSSVTSGAAAAADAVDPFKSASQLEESSIYDDDEHMHAENFFLEEEEEVFQADFFSPKRVTRSSSSSDTSSEASSSSSSSASLSVAEAPRSRRETYSISDQAFDFLMAGHDLEEPRLASLLSVLAMERLDRIATRCKIRCGEVFYVVGAPDPIGVLEEGEVYISQWDGQHRHNVNPSGPGSARRVLVTRSPCMHLGDVRRLQAVQNERLNTFVANRAGGIIFFSTKGIRSDADKMSTGDFDGDKYLVIANAQIVEAVQEHEPYNEPSAPEPSMVRKGLPLYESNLSTLTRPPIARSASAPTRASSIRMIENNGCGGTYGTPTAESRTASLAHNTVQSSSSSSSSAVYPGSSNTRSSFIPFPAAGFVSDYSSSSASNVAVTPSTSRATTAASITANQRTIGGTSRASATAEYSLEHSLIHSAVADDIDSAGSAQTPPHPSHLSLRRSTTDTSNVGAQLDQYYSDTIGRAIFEGMLRTASEMTVAASCTAWYCYADNPAYGPDSAEALECHKMFSIAMDAPKTGKSAPCRPDLLKVAQPIYLKKGALSSGKCSEEQIQSCLAVSSSILGEIFKTVVTTSREAQHRLGQSIYERAESGCGIAIPLDPCYSIRDGDFLVEWKKHVRDYGLQMRDALVSYENRFMDEVKKASKSRRMDGLKTSYRRIFEECVQKCRAKLYQRRSLPLPLPHEPQDDLEEIVMEAIDRHAWCTVAAAVYEATYMHANEALDASMRCNASDRRDKSRGPPLTFCWDVCGKELHWIKWRSELKKQGGGLCDMIVPSEKPFL